jgi:hypothetical protein
MPLDAILGALSAAQGNEAQAEARARRKSPVPEQNSLNSFQILIDKMAISINIRIKPYK